MQKSTGSSASGSEGLRINQLFAVGQSSDKGLADVETGSEVYMSELLVSIIFFYFCQAGFDMEDFDDAQEANEEDLIELNDDFANVKVLVNHIQDKLNFFIAEEE